MKTLFLFVTILLTSIYANAQFKSKALSDAKKYFSGYSSYEYSHKTQKISGLRYYYRCNVDGYKSAGFKCYPSAKEKKGLWIEYWSNGSFKDKGYWIGSSYTNVPNPSVSKMTESLNNSFDPIALFDASWLWDLLEIHEFELFTDMTGKNQPIWTSEQEFMTYGTVTASVIRGCCKVEKYKFEGVFKFKSTDCGKSFQFVEGYQRPGMYTKELLEEKSYSEEEGLALQKKTIGRASAEKKAKEEWDALPMLEIPKFDNEQEFAAFVYQTLTSGTDDEVKAIIYKTLPSYKFMEGSEYLLDWLTQDYVNEILDKVIGNNGVNVRSNYCPVINRYKNAKNSYQFHDKKEDKTLEIRTTEEQGKYKVKEFKIWLADNLKESDCTPMIEYETVTNKDFGFSIKMPKGYTTTKTDKSIILEHKVNGSKYIVAVTNFGDGESNANRMNQAKNNVDKHILAIHSGHEKVSDWEMNGVTGKEAFFLAENSKYERYKTIYLGDYNYEFWIIGLNFTTTDNAFFDSFKSDNEGGGSREGLSFNVGDPVEIHVGAGRYEKGNITAVNADGTYSIKVPNMGKTYTAPIDAIRADPTGKKVTVSRDNGSENTKYEVGDKVLVRLTKTSWKKATVEEIRADGKYRVKITSTGDQYYMPTKNLKKLN